MHNLSPTDESTYINQKNALAIAYAHQQGVLHRDLKPGNILIDANGQPHVTDFGLAKSLSGDATNIDLTATGQILGTPSYMSPEQALAKHQLVGVASDVYSLGAILYACLSGRGPFVADTAVDTIRQVIEKEPVSLRLLNPQVPKDLETICLKCLQKEPRGRYATAGELADDLQRFLDDRPVVARPVATTTKAWRWARRNPWVASLALLSVLLLLTGTGVSTYFAIVANQRAVAEKIERDRADREAEAATLAKMKTETALAREASARTEAEAARDAETRARQEAEREKTVAQQAQRRAEQARQAEATQRSLADQHRKLAQWQTYVARLQPLQQASAQQEWGHLDRLLREMEPREDEPDFRGWEWYFFAEQVRSVAPPLDDDHPFNGYFVHDSPRDRLFARVDGKLTIWDLKARELVSTLSMPAVREETLTVSPDGRLLAGGNHRSEVIIWEIESDRTVAELIAQDYPEGTKRDIRTSATAWNSDGSQLLTASRDGEIRIWQTSDWKLEKVLQQPSHRSTMGGMDWHPTSGLLTGHRFGWFRVWDMEAGKVIHTGKCRNSIIEHVKWSPSGDKFALAEDGLGIFRADGKRVGEHLHAGHLTSIAWFDDDVVAVGGAEQNIAVCDASTSTVTNTIRVHSGHIKSLSKLDDHVVLSAAMDKSLRFTQTTAMIPTMQIRKAHDAAAWEVEWHPDGSKLVTAGLDAKARIWDARKLEVIHDLTGHKHGHVWDVAWNNAGDRLATIDHAKQVNIYDASDGTIIRQGIVRNVDHPRLDWRPSNDQLIIGGNRPQIIDAETLKQDWIADESQSGWRIEMHFSPDATRAAGISVNGNLYLVDTQKRMFNFTRHLNDPGTGASAWSPDGKRFVAAGTDLTILETTSFNEIAKLEGHRGPIGGVCFNPQGTRIASAGNDGKVYLWDVATGDLLIRIPVLDSIALHAIEWSPDGTQIAMVSADGDLIVLGSSNMNVHDNRLESIDENAIMHEEELAALSLAIEKEPSKPFHFIKRGEWYAKHLAFAEAFADFESFLEQSPQSGWQRCQAAYAALMIGDEDGFKRHLHTNLNKLPDYDFAQEKGTGAYVVVAACLRPNNVKDFTQLMPLAMWFRDENPTEFHETKPLILLKLRLGEYETALKLLEPHLDRGRFLSEQILNDSVHAIALHHVNRRSEAIESLLNAETLARTAWPEPNKPYEADYGDLRTYVEANVLLEEARQLVQNVPGTNGVSAATSGKR